MAYYISEMQAILDEIVQRERHADGFTPDLIRRKDG